jgi:2-polyprenyl-6-methoxyphenol hydroxylase-like FAD-dependent oxidoreductase
MVADTAFPDRPQFGVIVPLENREWMVTLGGFNGVYPPADDQGFLEFARSLATPLYSQALEQAEPITKVRAFRRLEMRWNHFEAYDHPLSNFIALGDSAWTFNPHYGQGMSIAVGCARILRDVLAQNAELESLPRRYYARARKFAWPQWEGTAQLDLRWNGTEGERPWHSKLSHPLAELIVRAGQHDRTVSRALLAGAHFLKTPADVLTPNVLARVALYGLKQLGPNRSRFSAELPAAPIRRAPLPMH